MFAVIRENRDRSITRLLTCGSLEAVIVASQLEKNKVSFSERSTQLFPIHAPPIKARGASRKQEASNR